MAPQEMAARPLVSYTQVSHKTSYPSIDPAQPSLSTAGKVVLITGASSGIGRATASSYAASKPRAIIILGRRADALGETDALIRASHSGVTVQAHAVDVCDGPALRAVMKKVVEDFGDIDILIHCAAALAPVIPVMEEDPATFLDAYRTTLVGTLSAAQALILANKTSGAAEAKPVTFINISTAGIILPPFPGLGSYVSSKLASAKLLQAFAAENKNMRLHHVHPGFIDTAMSSELGKTLTLPFPKDDISLPSDFLVWIASPEAEFLKERFVFAAWDVDELKSRKNEIVGSGPGTGDLWLELQGFPRYANGQALPGSK